MSIFDYTQEELLGTVDSVDTSTIVIRVENSDALKDLQVNQLISIQSSKVGQHLIGIVSKIIRKSENAKFIDNIDNDYVFDVVKVSLIGTHFDRLADKENVFCRSLATVPTINAECHIIQGYKLRKFMQSISSIPLGDNEVGLQIGSYSIDLDAKAYLNGNKFFQRHAVIVGSTGSGKSWCVAKILEQVAELKSANAILLDIHGEYSSLHGDNFTHLKIATPNDNNIESALFLPYWLLTYDETLSFIIERSDNNAPNQSMLFGRAVLEGKKKTMEDYSNITLDSPIPYNFKDLIKYLKGEDTKIEKNEKSGNAKQGAFYGKLTRFIQRLESKYQDRRLNFMFANHSALLDCNYMNKLCHKLMSPSNSGKNGVKILDFSAVPSDILPLTISLIARLIFSVQQWMSNDCRHPIAIFCDEAHLYIPNNTERSVNVPSLSTFERISKEGRKYGVSLVVISQRPSEVSRTVLSQSNNFIAMRLTNLEDQSVIKRLLPDNLGNFSDLLPILNVGEALVVGDSSLLPIKIRISKPKNEPRSATVDFWDEWSKVSSLIDINGAIESLRNQSK